METIFVRFSDAEETRIADVFSCAQDSEIYPYQGTVTLNDPRYVDFLSPLSISPDLDAARAWRDAEIIRVTWLRDRHRDEIEIGSDTTLTAEQYAELLAYIKALRDWPTAVEFPVEESKPKVPEWVQSQVQ